MTPSEASDIISEMTRVRKNGGDPSAVMHAHLESTLGKVIRLPSHSPSTVASNPPVRSSREQGGSGNALASNPHVAGAWQPGNISSVLAPPATVREQSTTPDSGNVLRPHLLVDYYGQPKLRSHLEILLGAARLRGEVVPHFLFAGPPGLGKTTIAGIVAAEMGVKLVVTSAPALRKVDDLVSMLTTLNHGDVFFVDEIHRLPRQVEEVLYSAMEDFCLDVGGSWGSDRIHLPHFTLIGATTRTGLITGPLRDRFGFVARLDYYEVSELRDIIIRSARIMGVDITIDGAHEIASRSRGTPRIANRLLAQVRDFALVRANGDITRGVANAALAVFEVDELGLDKVDIAILDALCGQFEGKAVGVSTLASCVGEEVETLEDAYEPYLLRMGLITRTPKGRVATEKGREHWEKRVG